MKRGLLSKLGFGQPSHEENSHKSLVQSRMLAKQNIKNLLNETRANSSKKPLPSETSHLDEVDFLLDPTHTASSNQMSETKTLTSQKILPASAKLIEETWQTDIIAPNNNAAQNTPTEHTHKPSAPDITSDISPANKTAITHVKRPQSGIFHHAMQKIEEERGIISKALSSSYQQTSSSQKKHNYVDEQSTHKRSDQDIIPEFIETPHVTLTQSDDDLLFPLDHNFHHVIEKDHLASRSPSEMSEPPHIKKTNTLETRDAQKPSKKELLEIKRTTLKKKQQKE